MLTQWTTLSLYDLDSGRELKGAERIAKLREYRDTAGMVGVALVDPTEAKSPEDFDALCEAGPAASEIDWTGLASAVDAEFAADREAEADEKALDHAEQSAYEQSRDGDL
jgi:hypothetical protein